MTIRQNTTEARPRRRRTASASGRVLPRGNQGHPLLGLLVGTLVFALLLAS